MNAQTAAAQLKTAFKKVGHVKVEESEKSTILSHYATAIVTVDNDKVLISNGGYFTVTTKKFINLALNTIGIRATISQRKGVWYLLNCGIETEFKGSLSITAN